MTYIATFFSHFGAIRYKKLCDAQGFAARTMRITLPNCGPGKKIRTPYQITTHSTLS